MGFWEGAGHFLGNILDPATYIEKGIRTGNFDPTSSQFGPGGAVEPTVAGGGILDTAQAEEDRKRQMAIIAQLQQQAMNGDPVALAQLQKATQKTVAGQSAVGQTSAAQQGTDPNVALRNILGGQAHAQQVGVGQADVLKALTQQQAQEKLAGILGGVRGQDIGQAQGQQAAGIGMTEANAAEAEKRDKDAQQVGKSMLSTIPVVGQGLGKSDGGKIGGRPKVPWDADVNDTVPAMLSPGEIVIPRSHAGSPEAAASFVAALFRQEPQHFAEGGGVQVPIQGGTGHGLENRGAELVNTLLRTKGLGPHQIVPYTPLQTGPADQIHGQQSDLSQAFADRATGGGPSAVGGQLQAATDRNLQAAMAASAQGQRPLGTMGDEQQRLAGESAMARGNEVSQAQSANAALVAQQRGQSLQQALIAQRAALNTTLTNMGLDAAHRLAILNTLAAAGQGMAAAGASGIFADSGQETSPETLSALSSQPFDYGQGAPSDPGEWDNPYDTGRGSSSDLSGGEGESGFAHGGQVHHYAEGGKVPPEIVILTDPAGRKFAASRTSLSPSFLAKYAAGTAPPEAFDAIPDAPRGPAVELPPAPLLRDPQWDAQMAELWAKARADGQAPVVADRGAPIAAPPAAWDSRPAPVDWEAKMAELVAGAKAAEHPIAPVRADGPPPRPRPPSMAPRAQQDYLTVADSQGRPMRVARAGLSPALVQRFAQGGPVLPPDEQDRLTASLMAMGVQQPSNLGSTAGALSGQFGAPQAPPSAPAPVADPSEGVGFAASPAGRAWKALQGWGADSPVPGEFQTEQQKKTHSADPGYEARVAEQMKKTPAELSAAGAAKKPAVPLYSEPGVPKPEATAAAPTTRARTGAPAAPRPDANQATIDADTEAQQRAIAEQGRLAEQQAEAKATELQRTALDMAAAEAQQAKLAADYQAKRADGERKFADLTQKYADATVDPGRFWGTRTTGDKVLAGIGLALGALGGAADGVNKSVGIINQAIDRDIDAQKANIAKAGEVAGRQGQLLGIMRANFGDDAQALAATKASMLQAAQLRVDGLLARTSGPIEKAKLEQVSQALGAQRAQESQKHALQVDALAKDQAVKWAQLRAAAGKGASGESVETLASVDERAANIDNSIRDLRTLVKKAGTYDATGAHNALLEQQLDSIAIDAAKLYDPKSVARKEEVEGFRKLLFSPGMFQRDSTALDVLAGFERMLKSRRKEAYAVRGLPVPGGQ